MSDVEYLLSLEAVRERAQQVLKAAEAGKLHNFDYDASKMATVVDFVVNIISRDFGPDRYKDIPPHGRWQHFDVGGVPRIARLIEQWQTAQVDKTEIARRLIDLFFVSVLLDAGAGDVWTFKEPVTNNVYNRSEGIAVASLYMVSSGALDSTGKKEVSVDAAGLVGLTDDVFVEHFQVTEANPIIGVSPRVQLLNSIGRSLQKLPEIVGASGRPGNMVDYVLKHSAANTLDYKMLWATLQKILIPAWPKDRPTIDGHPIGDAWPLQILADLNGAPSLQSAKAIQPFHKLTQWLGYSLTVPFVRILGLKTANANLGTGLPEYRNGGLFVDLGVLTLKPDVAKTHTKTEGGLPEFLPTEDAIVEWRAMTVALLDALHEPVAAALRKEGVELSMAQMLEAGTWKGGRELAAKLRPTTKSSPIVLLGDGTLF